jgi:hypothetical protein
MSQDGGKEEVHQHSGWLVPAVFLFAVTLLCGLFLGWSLRPGPKVPSAPAGQSARVGLRLGSVNFRVPANYIQNPIARAGGEQDMLTLAALFPGWHGNSESEARLFQVNAPDSAVVRISLRADQNPMDAKTRLARIYRPYFLRAAGSPGPFGLTQYGFASQSGYERNDLFVGEDARGPILILCERPAPDLPSPNCQATDRPLAAHVSYSFRFKRAFLGRWREVASGVDGLIDRFKAD